MLGGTRSVERNPLFGFGENKLDFPGLEPGNAKEMPVREGGGTCWKAAR